MKRVRSFINEVAEFLETLNPNGQEIVVNAANDLKYCPFFMVASVFFGKLTPDQRNELRELGPLREDLFRAAFKGGINRYRIAKYLPGSAMPRLRDFQVRWESFVRQAWEESIMKEQGAIVPLWESMKSGELSLQEVFFPTFLFAIT